MKILFNFYDLIAKLSCCFKKCKLLSTILEVIGIIFSLIFIPIYFLIIPIYPHFVIKNLYYSKFLPEIKKQYNNKLIPIFILLGEEIFSFVFIFILFCLHYVFIGLCIPIFCLIILIRNIIYNIPYCDIF